MIPLLWWASGVAEAGKKPPEPPPGPDPAAQALAEEAKACAPDVPENYQIHTGYASNPDQTQALTAAIEDAKRRTLDAVCAGKLPTRCEVLSRHLEAWKTPYWNPTTGRACAHVGVRRDFLDDDKGDQRRLSVEVSRLGADLAAKVGATPVWIEPPTWTQTGCHAGSVGSSLVAELRNAIAAAGTVKLATQAESAARVHIALDLRATEVVVSVDLREPRSAAITPLVGFTVPGDLFDLQRTSSDCRFDQELGLTSGQRDGADGRTVRVTVPAEGYYCEGDRIDPVVVVDRPSRVRVFSVARDGTAFLVWPPPGEKGIVEATVSLGEMDLYRGSTEGDEKLLAVAVGLDGTFGTSNTWTAFCKAPAALTAAAWAKDAAAGAATFQVMRYDTPTCLRRGVVQKAMSSLPEAPLCR